MKYDYKCVAVAPDLPLIKVERPGSHIRGPEWHEKAKIAINAEHENAKKIEELIKKHAVEGWEFLNIYNLGNDPPYADYAGVGAFGVVAVFRRPATELSTQIHR